MMNYELNLENVRLRSLVEATETDLFEQKKKRRRLEKENAALVKRWEELGEWVKFYKGTGSGNEFYRGTIKCKMKELEAGSK